MSLLKELVKNLAETDEFNFGGGEMDAGASHVPADNTSMGGNDEEMSPEDMGDEDESSDNVTMDVPLLIRIMEWSHEDAQSDVELHKVAENLVAMAMEGRPLTMEDYDAAIQGVGQSDEEGMGDEQDSGYGDRGTMPATTTPSRDMGSAEIGM
jgi:hypothetical protein